MAANLHFAVPEPEIPTGSTESKRMSVAIIGPDEASRKVVWKAVAQSQANDVQEILKYPASYVDLTALLEQNFDVLMIDVESDPATALQLIWKIKTLSASNVIAYAKQDDPQLSALCLDAGAQDFLPLPQEAPASPAVTSPAQPRLVPPSASLNTSAAAAPVVVDVPPPASPAPEVPALPAPDAKASEDTERSAKFVRGSDGQWRPRQSPAQAAAPPRPLPIPPRIQAAPAPGAAIPATLPAAQKQPVQPPVSPAVRAAASDAAAVPPPQEPDIEHELRTLFRGAAETGPDEVKAGGIAKKAAAAGAAVLVLVAAFAYMHASRTHEQVHAAPRTALPSASQQLAATPPPAVTVNQASGTASRPSAAQAALPAPLSNQETPTVVQPPVNRVSASMMTAQLSAPSRISASLKRPTATDAAPGAFAANAIDSGTALPSSLFAANHGPRVTTSPVISAGVAQGLLIYKTQPVYPELAKAANMSGTVVLKAQISKSGKILGLHVISGPPMFVEPAVTAVKSWRYKPYMLNNQPIDVETNISVVFSLNGH